MIAEKNLFEIGKILKPHGVKGELTVFFHEPEYMDSDCDYYFFQLEGLFVPFYIEDFHFKSNVTAQIKFRLIDSIEEATIYSNTPFYIPKELVNKTQDILLSSIWEQFTGYTVYDENRTIVGEIASVDSSTINVLFVVVKEEQELLIPATEDFILNINDKEKELHLKLPHGLLNSTL